VKQELIKLLKQPLRTINVKQNSPEWWELRKTKRTASETPIVMSLSPWSSPGKLAIEKFTASKPKPDGLASQWGHKHEGMARRHYEDQFKIRMRPAVLIRGDYMASLDGWSDNERVVLEIKCPFSRVYGNTWEKAVDGQVPAHYYAQVQHQLLVSGSRVCHFWAFNPKLEQGIMIELKPDTDFYYRILRAWKDFFDRYA
jgi:putative phage-type endonuclease